MSNTDRPIDLVKSNSYLFNMLFRHQVYLEGVKLDFAANYRVMLRKLYDEFAKYIGQSRYHSLDGYTRAEFRQYIQRFQRAQQIFYSEYTAKLIALLKAFVVVNLDVTSSIFEAATNQTTLQRSRDPQAGDKPPLYPLAATRNTKSGADKLWAQILPEIIPANGMTISEMLRSFGDRSSTEVIRRLMVGYANGETTNEVMSAIAGDPTVNYRDGLFAKLNAQNTALVAIALQQLSNLSQAAVASVHFNRYQWVSILDSRTTPICRERNGNIYTYGDGPLPPAHYGCRSKDVPLVGDELHDIPDTFDEWLRTQPEAVLTSMLGASLAAKVIDEDPSVTDLTLNDVTKNLTLDQFQSKIDTITV